MELEPQPTSNVVRTSNPSLEEISNMDHLTTVVDSAEQPMQIDLISPQGLALTAGHGPTLGLLAHYFQS